MPNITDDLIMWHDMSSGAATMLDQHGTNDFTENNSVTVSSGGGPNSQDVSVFNASADYYNIASQLPFDYYNGFTISIWVYFTSFSTTGNWIVNHRAAPTNQYFQLNSDGGSSDKFRFDVIDSGGTARQRVLATAGPSTATWYHVVGSHDGTETELWVDGVSQGTDSTALGSKDTSATNFRLGQSAWASASTTPHAGRLGMFGLWERAISSAEIAFLYNSGNGVQYADFPNAGLFTHPGMTGGVNG